MRHIPGVYMIQSTSHPERVYIGSTSNLNHRKQLHLFDLRRNKHVSNKLQQHFNKYGETDLVFEVLESETYFNRNHLLSREQGWYIPYGYKNINGLPYFNNAPIAGSQLGIKRTEEQCRKNGDSRRGTHASEETKDKMRKALSGRHLSEEHIRKAAAGRKKPLLQYDLNMNFIQEWPSAVDAAKFLHLHPATINGCCPPNSRYKTAGGFIWYYKYNNNK